MNRFTGGSGERATAISEEDTMNELDQIHPSAAEFSLELIDRLAALDRQRVDPGGRIHDAEVAVLVATKALHAAKTATADLVEQKRLCEPAAAEAEDREALQLDRLLISARENERACDFRRRQAVLDVGRLKLELQAARYQECITGTIAQAFQGFVDEAERFAQVYQATQGRPLAGFDAVAVALRALNVQMNVMAGQRAPVSTRNAPVANETSSVVAAVEELQKRVLGGAS
jgi:hypothetical protein